MSKEIQQVRAFDIVRIERRGKTSIGMVTEISGDNSSSVRWFVNDTGMYNAWIPAAELEILGNAMNCIARAMTHPMGNGARLTDQSFPMTVDETQVPYKCKDDR